MGNRFQKKHNDGRKRFFQRFPIARNLIIYGRGGGLLERGGGGVEHKRKAVPVKLRTSCALHTKKCRSLPTLKGLHTPSVM